ncbi:MAG: hypothetical protein QW555_03455 [Nitrososphaerota archaeon]
MMRGTTAHKVVATLKRHGPMPAWHIARKSRCNSATVQAILNKLVYSGLLSFAEMRLGRFASPRRSFGSNRLLRVYYIPKIHSNNRVYSVIRNLIKFRKPANIYERRAFGMWLSSSILPSQVREIIHSMVLESRTHITARMSQIRH